jgi:pimeloyl-ACP methyl ester carboxylesterase
MALLPRLLRAAVSPPTLGRSTALALTERLSAVTHLVASLEYLATEGDRRPGGLNDWRVMRQDHRSAPAPVRRLLDTIGGRRGTRLLHGLRAAAAVGVLAPLPGRRRAAAGAVLSGTSLALYVRHHYGADGADQVSFLVQSAATVARAAERHPEVVDACLWFVSLQSTLSYAVSGWVKLTGETWRSGAALPGIMRTETYGDSSVLRLIQRHPRASRVLADGVLALECLFPLVFLGRGRPAPLMVGSAAAFHLANARVMGLGRFLWSFCSMHPAVLYTDGPGERALPGGGTDRRDDLLPAVAGALLATAAVAGQLLKQRQRRVVAAGRGDERALTTRAGNLLRYRRTGALGAPQGTQGPLVVLVGGVSASEEHWEWLAGRLGERYPVVGYQRAGYGASEYRRADRPRLDHAVADLVDLVTATADGRPVVLLGHSLGGWLAWRAAGQLGESVRAVVLLDPSHPAELRRSTRQARGQAGLTTLLSTVPASLRLGLGPLLDEPDWLYRLPRRVRTLARAHYRDAGSWQAAAREWSAAQREFEDFDGPLPAIAVPALVVTAGETERHDPVQKQLHTEFAAAAPRSAQHTVDGAGHLDLLMVRGFAEHTAALTAEFLDGLAGPVREEGADDERATA